MAAIALAILGKSNEPLYIREFLDEGVSAAPVSDEELFALPPPASQRDGRIKENKERHAQHAAAATATSEVGGIECSIQLQFVLHAAVDRFDELAGSSGYAWRAPGDTGTDAMFVGLLKPVDSLRVYGASDTTSSMVGTVGPNVCMSSRTLSLSLLVLDLAAGCWSGYMTTTQIRFVLVVEDHHVSSSGREQRSVDDAIYRLLVKLHRLYVDHTLNPFGGLSGPIQSPRMDRRVRECVAAFNRSVTE